MKHVIVCDLDGTLTDPGHRLPLIRGPGRKRWDAFFDGCGDDPPHHDLLTILDALRGGTRRVVYVTGRPERTRPATLAWLRRHGLPEGDLHMRRDGDHRADDVVKEALLDHALRLVPDDVLCVLDDRDRVVAMWRRRGFRVLQVADGDF